MYKILNKFLGSKYFDNLPRFLSRKIFKIFKIFFVETNLKNLPNQNHPTKIDKKNQTEIKLDSTSKEIISILDEYIKPAVSSDGGNILFESYNPKKKLVKVILQGACSGCPSSTITLKNGIENMLKEMLSGKVEVVEAING